MASAHDRITGDFGIAPSVQSEQRATHRCRFGLLFLVGGLGFFAGILGGIIAAAIIVPFSTIIPNGSVSPSGMGWRGTPTFPSSITFGSAVVDVFTVATATGAPAMLPLEEHSGRGVIVSNDGWVATVRSVLPSTARVRTERRSIVVGRDRRIRAVDRIAFDPISDLAFLHVIDLDGAVLPIRERMDLRANESLFAPSAYGGVVDLTFAGTRTIRRAGQDAAWGSSDRWATAIMPWPTADVLAGTPFMDASGSLVGIEVGESGDVLPAGAIASALPSLFARSVVERNALGVTYRDAAEFGHELGERTEGVTIITNGVAPTSPLRGKLEGGDRITAVGEDMLTAYRYLSDLIQEYPIGGRVTLHVIHGGSGKEESLEVALGRLTGESLLVAAAK